MGDLDVLLVGPAGQRVMLMSDAGGSADVSGVSLNRVTLPASLGTGSAFFRLTFP